MELLTLDENYQPSEMIERYASLIWNERYLAAGDFQLVTTDVERMINSLPLESLVTIRESTVPMIVESYKIEKKIDGAPTLTISGRSFESVLERRIAAKISSSTTVKERWVEFRKKESDAAYQAIRQTIGDEIRTSTTPTSTIVLDAVSPNLSPNDGLPMVDLPIPADYVNDVDGGFKEFEIKLGNLYSVVLELLAANNHGLKSVRPDLYSNKIAIEIYNGADLTNDVVFDARFDQFEGSTYLLSYMGSTNQAWVFGKSLSLEVDKNQSTEASEPTGLLRRNAFVDLSGESSNQTEEVLQTRGLIELYNHNATALFDGQISEQVARGYNRDYFLGDIIRLDGEYGLSQNVRVAEFIRSDDSTGSKAYPTFEAIVE